MVPHQQKTLIVCYLLHIGVLFKGNAWFTNGIKQGAGLCAALFYRQPCLVPSYTHLNFVTSIKQAL